MEPINDTQPQIVYAVFNKHNGVLFHFERDKNIADSYSKDNFLIKEVTLRPGEYYFGDYYTGKVYSQDDKPLVREDEMEEEFYQGILREFSLVKQLITIASVLEANENIIKTEGFKEFIKLLKNKKMRYDESLKVVSQDKNSFNFISLKDLEELSIKRMEGIV